MDTAAAEKLLTAGAKAPRVSLEEVERAIKEGKVTFTVLPNGRTTVAQVEIFGERFSCEGYSACVSKENFNQEMGESAALKLATNEVWKALGTVLAWKLSLIDAAGPASRDLLPLGSETKTYVGTKVVHGTPMSRGEYNGLRGWTVSADENPDDAGYLVEYTDGGASNVVGFAGYLSWSPKEVFERAYTVSGEPRSTSFLDRLKVEAAELEARYEKLRPFLKTEAFAALPPVEQQDLKTQADCQEEYLWLLKRRIARASQG
jgi:hypothetical protein